MSTQQIVWMSVAAALFLFWLAFAVLATPKIEAVGTIAVMQFDRTLGMLALTIALTPPTLLGTLAWHIPWRDQQSLALVGGSFFALSLLAGLLLIEIVRVRIVLTPDGITRHSPWSGTDFVKWSDVTRIRWSSLNCWYVITTDTATIRVSHFLSGQPAFIQAMNERVAPEKRVV